MKERLLTHHIHTLQPYRTSWRSQPPGALLILGSEALGSHLVMALLTQDFLCDTKDSCNQCPSCMALKENRHFSATWMYDVKIDAIRELLASRSISRVQHRCVILPDIDTMSLGAANALLKILEEPPPAWTFILSSMHGDKIPATIRSRCQKLHLKPLCLPGETFLAPLASSHPLTYKKLTQTDASRILVDALLGKEKIAALTDWATKEFEDFMILLEHLTHAGLLGTAPITRSQHFWLHMTDILHDARSDSNCNRKILIQHLFWELMRA